MNTIEQKLNLNIKQRAMYHILLRKSQRFFKKNVFFRNLLPGDELGPTPLIQLIDLSFNSLLQVLSSYFTQSARSINQSTRSINQSARSIDQSDRSINQSARSIHTLTHYYRYCHPIHLPNCTVYWMYIVNTIHIRLEFAIRTIFPTGQQKIFLFFLIFNNDNLIL